MKLLRETWLLFLSNLRMTVRNPVWLFFGLVQPLIFLSLFAPLLQSIARMPGFPAGGALNVFTPGLLVQMVLFGGAYVGFGLIAELRAGVVERMRVTPVSRLAPLLARALRDIVVLEVQILILIVVAVPFGFRINMLGLAQAVVLFALLGMALASASYALALRLRDENAFAPALNFFVQPLMLLAGIFLPMSLAPVWLRDLANVNPLTYVVSAARALTNGRFADASIWEAFLLMAILMLVSFFWAASSYRKATA